MPLRKTNVGRPLIVGEVLVDRYPDGTEVLGGAPLNVAWHLAGFGLDPLLVSRIGTDRRGGAVSEALVRHAMDVSGLQIDDHHATGIVNVAMHADGPRFDITPDQAWDHLDAALAREATVHVRPTLVYHGTLLARTPGAREALLAIAGEFAGVPRFVDVNLRAPWWNRAIVERVLRGATHVKLNEDELLHLWPRFALEDDTSGLLRELGAAMVVVTRAEYGATIATETTRVDLAPRVVMRGAGADAVGAGDAMSAVVIAGVLCGWPLRRTLARALAFASEICAIRGAIPKDDRIYGRTLDQWRAEADG